MKAKIFILAVAFLIPLFLYTANPINKAPENKKTTDSLYAMGGWLTYDKDSGVIFPSPPSILVFTGNDIQSFNISTREIVFTTDIVILSKITQYGFNIYLNDKPILEIIQVRSGLSSYYVNDLVLYCEFEDIIDNKIKYRFYLHDGYPDNWDGGSNAESVQEERKANAEKRKEGWDIFIKYLSDAGKIVEGTSIAPPPKTPELNSISIFPNPTKGELRMENGKLRMDNVQIFDIFGKQLLILNSQFSILNSIDISHLPAGTYFVQITTEKGVVTKKIIKL